MRFTIPQFIEREAKIIGPLTFKQFIYFGIAGMIGFVLYFMLPLPLFILAALILVGITASFTLIKKGGRPISAHVANFLKFHLSPKMYLWEKEEKKVAKVAQTTSQEETPEDETPLKIAPKSRLKRKKTDIEAKKTNA
ncbi:MAG: hypothetical protein GF370_04615 [Candidatus Nealsonbacteria bacterium]|nr:hypothetical protein [Candidatus Nealsonbacteria bacterium]